MAGKVGSGLGDAGVSIPFALSCSEPAEYDFRLAVILTHRKDRPFIDCVRGLLNASRRRRPGNSFAKELPGRRLRVLYGIGEAFREGLQRDIDDYGRRPVEAVWVAASNCTMFAPGIEPSIPI